MTRLVAGVGCLALSCVALLFARDVWHADDALRDADLRGSVQPLSARSWESGETIPFGAARAALGIDDDLEYRALVARAIAMTKQEAVTPAQFRERLPVQAALHRVKNGDGDARRRSDAANLLGLLILGDPEDLATSPLETPVQRAVREFRFAVRVDPTNDAAKANLELMLQNQRAEDPQGQGSAGGGSEAGSGAAGPGSTRSRLLTTLAVSFSFVTPFGLLFALGVARSRRRVPAQHAPRAACANRARARSLRRRAPGMDGGDDRGRRPAPRRRARPARDPDEDDAARPRGRGGVLRVRRLALDARRRLGRATR